MLKSIRLRNFRSYVDTDPIELSQLNVFIGPNNAGKSAFLSAIELLLRSMRNPFMQGPLAFNEISSFASFDSVLRRHWTPKEGRPREFVLNYTWSAKDEALVNLEFVCRGRKTDNLSYVREATYRLSDGQTFKINSSDEASVPPVYQLVKNGSAVDSTHVVFQGPMPVIFSGKASPRLPIQFGSPFINVEVVHPYRPVPRSFYVLDDPGLSMEDRLLLSFLIDVWKSEERKMVEVKQRIVDSLKTLGLITHLDIHQIGKRLGPKVVEISVAPKLKRQSVTIADVGFGLSQVLPLAAYDARLERGYLIAYQPEVHLHPYAQSRLADLFAKSVKRGNQVFVETHSPDLILRLQAKVVSKELRPDEVKVFCLSNERGTTEIVPVSFRPEGSPTIPWPPGFLDTSLTLARDLVSRRLGAANV